VQGSKAVVQVSSFIVLQYSCDNMLPYCIMVLGIFFFFRYLKAHLVLMPSTLLVNLLVIFYEFPSQKIC